MIALCQFAPAFGLRNASPFCLKLETYLRMADVAYVVEEYADLSTAPKGKMPYIKDGDRKIGDSTLVIDYLKATYGDPLDADLTPEQQAIALAMQRLIEDHFYWALVYSRWEEEVNWPLVKDAYFSELPPVIKQVIPGLARQNTRKNLKGQGMGLHSGEEIYAMGQKDLTAIATFLGDKPFFMGDQPTSLDASAYGSLSNVLCPLFDTPLLRHARQYPQLAAFCQRMEARYYADD
ncbi:glutathione S-transferase family protein [filamentous cyanobacterium LEGE 11480]|uniref:Glutathione S-transferase family protein n=1 Tax=Romeriopsis navalis LEGE 11480 TaxID=2777977 RepID=A0A928VTD9_9CYAN|nr:glutathione S-transferase family protein [Romeriopsis navalis]MBE9031889.1 glutathione S-transferase family protein [Romeriopsis navalis LEGE 11480]